MNKTIFLAGGCFWGMQKYFDQFAGILETETGYANGPTADPLWAYITSTTKFEKFTDVPQNEPVAKQMEQVAAMMDPDWNNNGNIKWNFTKFLYDRDGNFVGRYEPLISFNTIAADINKVI